MPGSTKYLAQDVDLHALLDEVINKIALQPRFEKIDFVRQFDPNLPLIQADAAQLQQVFVNLFNNSADAMENVGTITISTHPIDPQSVEIRVSDTGSGIPAENLSKLFTPFFTTKPAGKGTGLGLSIVYGIIKLHHGQITVQSQVGHGTTVIITLPVRLPDGELNSGRCLKGFDRLGFWRSMDKTDRILIIDDEAGIRQGCCRVLQPQGFTVETAENFQEGLRKIQEETFDLVLLDVMLPDGRGIDLLEPIRERDPETVSIIITGYATVELAVDTIKKGAYNFISKPFTADMLLMTVNQGLEKRHLSLEAKRLQTIEHETVELARARDEAERLNEFKSSFLLRWRP